MKNITDRGVQIHYLAGNHDFALNGFLNEELGIHIHADPTTFEIGNRQLFAAHGDGLIRSDWSSRALKRLFRNRWSIRFYRLLHPALGFGFASYLSHLSRNHQPDENRDQAYIDFARSKFDEVDFVVLGHTHKPLEHREAGKTYVNTGDWIHYFTYARLEDGQLKLETWAGPSA